MIVFDFWPSVSKENNLDLPIILPSSSSKDLMLSSFEIDLEIGAR